MKKNKDLNLNRHSDYLGLFSIYYRTQKFPPELKSHIFDLETCIFFYIRLYHSTTLSLLDRALVTLKSSDSKEMKVSF